MFITLQQLLLFVSFWVSAYSNIIVFGNVGEEVILPCTIEYKEEFSYKLLFVRWKTKDIFVQHFYYGNFQEKHQNKIFKGRTQLFFEEFPKGNLSLLLNGTQKFDAGIYECFAFLSKVTYTKKIELVVRDKQNGFTNESSIVQVSFGLLAFCVVMGLIAFLRRRKRSRGRAVLGSRHPISGMTSEQNSPVTTPEKLKTN
ncbi:V-set domain-containing T-cell activation inhibitor 1-like [Hyla sarda]|uniref:V-set domain-containing T-cell activation inhibitor 1-like n=1 Tax=Hyla sarda TaxID=327740 RepID=UPI0024C33618|nr:V-set domain-containing T-cell activation inhibitor 1-like [Hyla sarda]